MTPKLKTPGGIVIDADKLHEWALEFERSVATYNEAKGSFERSLEASARAAKAVIASHRALKDAKLPWELMPREYQRLWQGVERPVYLAKEAVKYLPEDERGSDD